MIKVQPTAVSPVPAPKRDPELRKAAEAFESVILRQMMASMRKAKLGDEMFGSSATDNFREMADARLADNMAGLRQFGIADLVEQQLRKLPVPFAPSIAGTPPRPAQPNGVSTTLDTNGHTK